MPKPIIASDPPVGKTCEILHLPDALKRHHTGNTVAFIRCSTATTCEKGSLDRQEKRTLDARHAEYERLQRPGARLRAIVRTQESGRMSQNRRAFRRALYLAKRFDAVLYAEDVTRFLRAETGGKTDEPKPADKSAFWNLVGDVPLATVIDPTLPLSALHSKKTSLGMQSSEKKPGRPTKVTRKLLVHILHLREFNGPESLPFGVERIARILCDRGFETTHRQVQTALNFKVPDGRGGFVRLMDLQRGAYRQFCRLEEDGRIDALLATLAQEDAE